MVRSRIGYGPDYHSNAHSTTQQHPTACTTYPAWCPWALRVPVHCISTIHFTTPTIHHTILHKTICNTLSIKYVVRCGPRTGTVHYTLHIIHNTQHTTLLTWSSLHELVDQRCRHVAAQVQVQYTTIQYNIHYTLYTTLLTWSRLHKLINQGCRHVAAHVQVQGGTVVQQVHLVSCVYGRWGRERSITK